MKKIALITICLLLIVCCFAGCSQKTTEYGEEILSNGTFEGNNLNGWSRVYGSSDTASPKLESVRDTYDYANLVGKYYLSVEASHYSGFTARVSVEKNKFYYLSAYVRIKSAISADDTFAGAFVAIDSDYESASAVKKDKTSEFEKIGVYFNSGNNTSVLVRFGVGVEDHHASGTADFDNISLTKVTPPVGELIYTLSDGGDPDAYNASYKTQSEGKLYMVLASVLGGLCLFAAYAAFRSLMSKKGAFLSPEDANRPVPFFKSSAFILILCELVGFALRLILINFVYGGSTMDGYVADANGLLSLGASKYYFENKVLTPIGSLYVIWMLAKLADPLGLTIGDIGFSIFLKIPAVLADLVIIFLIYMLANRKYNQYISAIFAGLYAVIPTFFFLSAGWGAYASIGVLFLLLSLTSILDRHFIRSIAFYSVALLFSTEVLLVLPLLLAYYVYVFCKSDDYKMHISASVTAAIILLYVVSIPFILSHFTAGHPFIVVKRYCQAFFAPNGFTENAFSLYGIFGFGAAAADTASFVFNWIFVMLMMGYIGFLFFKSGSRLDLILLCAFAFVFTAVMTSAVDALLLYFSLALLLVYGMITGDRRVLKLFGGFTMTTLLNTGYTMMIGGYFGEGAAADVVFMSGADPMLVIFSLVNVAMLAYFAYVTFDICYKEDVKGVVIVEGNYFKYAWGQIKKFGLAVGSYCKTIPSRFKKNDSEESDAGQGK